MQNFGNVCSFCNSPISKGQSICKDCIKLYDIKIGDHENDGCGCDSWEEIIDLFLNSIWGSETGITNH